MIEPEFHGIIDVARGNSYLFMPRFPQSYALWMGKILDCEHYKKKYEVDHVYYVDQVNTINHDSNFDTIQVCLKNET